MSRRGRQVVAVGLLAAVTQANAAEDGPRITCAADGVCVASRLPSVLANREVVGYVTSGLTTSLIITLSTRDPVGKKRTSNARIDLRFEPWEEFFDVMVASGRRPPRASRVPSRAALETWWRDLSLSFAGHAGARGKAGVELNLVPFSEEEEADARRWYAEALRTTREREAERGRGGQPDDELSVPFGPVLDALTLSSIKRHGVLRFSWSVQVEPGR